MRLYNLLNPLRSRSEDNKVIDATADRGLTDFGKVNGFKVIILNKYIKLNKGCCDGNESIGHAGGFIVCF